MPEGDTIRRVATNLGRVLEGEILLACRSFVPSLDLDPLVGRPVDRVESRGKHLLIHVAERVLWSHMRMSGSWHIYRPGEEWQKPARYARVVMETAAHVVVCFSAPIVRLLAAADVARHPVLSGLGPDLLAETFDERAALGSIRRDAARPIGEALLDQTAVSGIGNVYKSELLFLAGIDPFGPVAALPDGRLLDLLRDARAWMSRNLDGGPRTTRLPRVGERHWVYGRGGKPCRRCASTIRVRRQGVLGRSTYWCPSCQTA